MKIEVILLKMLGPGVIRGVLAFCSHWAPRGWALGRRRARTQAVSWVGYSLPLGILPGAPRASPKRHGHAGEDRGCTGSHSRGFPVCFLKIFNPIPGGKRCPRPVAKQFLHSPVSWHLLPRLDLPFLKLHGMECVMAHLGEGEPPSALSEDTSKQTGAPCSFGSCFCHTATPR